MASYVGLDPATDINWVTNPKARPLDLFVDGKIDAFVGFPPILRRCTPGISAT